jgi:predicted RNA-binding Zn-ribbon protein involved in translation (DUF1610 family)
MQLEAPWLNCPSCNKPLIEAQARGRKDKEGNEIEHRISCRCMWCDWRWLDDGVTKFKCECGTVAMVKEDDGFAYAHEVDICTDNVTTVRRKTLESQT